MSDHNDEKLKAAVKDVGGSAYPVLINNTSEHELSPFGVSMPAGTSAYFYGASLRDYFAAKAMQAIITKGVPGTDGMLGNISMGAYAVADAMLKERAK